MSDPFWDPIFARLIDDLETITDIIYDTPDTTLLHLVDKNPALRRACAPFIKGRSILDRKRFDETVQKFAEREAPLRRVLFFEWINAHPKTLAFPTMPITPETPAMLEAGEFGSPGEIAVLAHIDPRPTAAPVLKAYLDKHSPPKNIVIDISKENQSEIISGLRHEIKKLQRELKVSRERETLLQNKLSELGSHAADLEKELSQLKEEVEKSKLELKRAKDLQQELARVAQDRTFEEVSNESLKMEISELKERLVTLEKYKLELENTLSRRNSTIEELKSEIEKLKKERLHFDEAARKIARLSTDKSELEQMLKSRERDIPAQIVLYEPPSGIFKGACILESPGAGKFQLDAAFFKSFKPIEGEWFMLKRKFDGEINGVTPLENASKREVIGILQESANGRYIYVEETGETIPLSPEESCSNFSAGDVVAAVILPEFSERKTYAAHLRRLFTADYPDKPNKEADRSIDLELLRKKLDLISLSTEKLAEFLKDKNIKFTIENNMICFDKNADGLILYLRSALPFSIVCSRRQCLAESRRFEFPRRGRPGEICAVCHEEIENTADDIVPAEKYDFNGRSVLIVGGDAVGSAYRDVLAGHNLRVEWLSGFGNLSGTTQGFGDISAVVVILKQISHTLLRELNHALRDQKTPIFYANKRGTSGVLKLLVEKLKPTRIA